MSAAGQSSFERIPGTPMPGSNVRSSKLSQQGSEFPHDQHEGMTMGSTNGTNRRTSVPENRQNTPRRDGKVANMDWLAAQLSQRSVVEVTESTGMSEKAVQNVRRRKSKLSFDNLVDLCRN